MIVQEPVQVKNFDNLLFGILFRQFVHIYFGFIQFQAAIWHCLSNYAYRDAIFLAERLCTESKFTPNNFSSK